LEARSVLVPVGELALDRVRDGHLRGRRCRLRGVAASGERKDAERRREYSGKGGGQGDPAELGEGNERRQSCADCRSGYVRHKLLQVPCAMAVAHSLASENRTSTTSHSGSYPIRA